MPALSVLLIGGAIGIATPNRGSFALLLADADHSRSQALAKRCHGVAKEPCSYRELCPVWGMNTPLAFPCRRAGNGTVLHTAMDSAGGYSLLEGVFAAVSSFRHWRPLGWGAQWSECCQCQENSVWPMRDAGSLGM